MTFPPLPNTALGQKVALMGALKWDKVPDLQGSGPFPATYAAAVNGSDYVVFQPEDLAAAKAKGKLGVYVWGSGACSPDAAGSRFFLTDLASHGYVIAANGPGISGQEMVTDMRDAVDWAHGGGAAKYGTVDIERTATAGHSCGGLEAMSTAYHDPRIKRIALFDIAIFQDERRYLLKEINVPVAWFVGGPKDMGYPNVRRKRPSPLRFLARNEMASPRGGVRYLHWTLLTGNTGTKGLRSAERGTASIQGIARHRPRRHILGDERRQVRQGSC